MTTTDLVTVEPLLPMDPDAARRAMAQYQQLTNAMLTDDDWQQVSADRRFVKRSGFQKIASGYGISTEILAEHVDRDPDGHAIRAHATVRALHPSGRHADGSGHCSLDEARFRSSSARGKVDHDLAATAVTRATNRAISNLVGFGQVSAEELDGAAEPAAAAPALPWGPVATDDADLEQAAKVVELITGASPADAARFVALMAGQFNGIPQACLKMLRALTRRDKWATTPSAPENAPPPSGQGAYAGVSASDVYPAGHTPGD